MARTVESPLIKAWKSQLRKACLAENLDEVKRLLEEVRHYPDISTTVLDIALRTAVQDTVRTGKTAATHLLLVDYDAARFLSQRQFEVTLQQAVELKRPDDLIELLDCGGGSTLLEKNVSFARRLALLAALRGDKNSLFILSRNGVNIHQEDEAGGGRTLLIDLAADKLRGKNSNEIVEWFVSEKVNLAKKDQGERNALHWAAKTGKEELTRALLKFHPDIEAPSTRGRTALHLAAASGLPNASAIVDLLVKAGADVTKESDGGWTALHNASQVGDVAVVQRLLEAKANVNAVLSSGVTALHWACTKGHEHVARCLLATPGVRRHEEDIWGSTPMLRAAQNGHSSIVRLLAPEHDVERLSPAQRKACECKSFRATVIDFKYKETRRGHWSFQSLVNKETVFNVLYNPNYSLRLEQQPSSPNMRQNFRWIHLPANNVSYLSPSCRCIY